jgi:hypothetical protein
MAWIMLNIGQMHKTVSTFAHMPYCIGRFAASSVVPTSKSCFLAGAAGGSITDRAAAVVIGWGTVRERPRGPSIRHFMSSPAERLNLTHVFSK